MDRLGYVSLAIWEKRHQPSSLLIHWWVVLLRRPHISCFVIGDLDSCMRTQPWCQSSVYSNRFPETTYSTCTDRNGIYDIVVQFFIDGGIRPPFLLKELLV